MLCFSKFIKFIDSTLKFLIPILARIGILRIFGMSAQTKMAGDQIAGFYYQFWKYNEFAYVTFCDSYEKLLPFFSALTYFQIGTWAEFILSLTIFLGIFTRISSFLLLVITAIIALHLEISAWFIHIFWIISLAILVVHGPGCISLQGLFSLLCPRSKKSCNSTTTPCSMNTMQEK